MNSRAIAHRALMLMMMCALAQSVACRSTYYAVKESFGVHKRDILVDRVEEAQQDQEAAKETFRTALERFSDVVRQPDTALKQKYDALSSELDQCKDRANTLSTRIDSIETVSKDLFSEWRDELDQYSNADLRRSSERQLEATEGRYEDLIDAMRRAESKMEPVLGSFRDHVLFLKHNLNAQAIASLRGELTSLEDDTADLIREMEKAIAEADEFLREIASSGAEEARLGPSGGAGILFARRSNLSTA